MKTLSQIEFVFDLSDSYSDTYSKEEVGIAGAFTTSPVNIRRLYLYKGDESGELLEEITTRAESTLGSTTVVVKLSKEYTLEDGQKYTIVVPANCFWSFYQTYSTKKNR